MGTATLITLFFGELTFRLLLPQFVTAAKKRKLTSAVFRMEKKNRRGTLDEGSKNCITSKLFLG